MPATSSSDHEAPKVDRQESKVFLLNLSGKELIFCNIIVSLGVAAEVLHLWSVLFSGLAGRTRTGS